MSDDLSKRGAADRTRINIHEEHELRYWSEKFSITPDEVKKAVGSAGVMAADVEKHLKNSAR